MYRGKNLKKLLCMLITFSLVISGSAFQVLAMAPEYGYLMSAEESEKVGTGLTDEIDNSSKSVNDETFSDDAEQTTEEYNAASDSETADYDSTAGDDSSTESTEHSSESSDEAAGNPADGTTVSPIPEDSSLTDSSLTDSSLTDSSLTDSSLTDDSIIDPMVGAKNDIADGLYVIESALDTKVCIGIAGNSRDNSANAQLVANNGGFGQAFYVKKISDGVYSVTNYNSGKALHTKSAGKTAGTNVMQYEPRNSVAQKWIFKDAATSGYVTIQPSYCNLQLDCYGGKSAIGTNLHLNKVVSAKRQMWKLVPASGKVAKEASLVAADIAKGYYTIGLAANTSQVLDVAAASLKSGADVQIYKDNGTYAQAFQILPQGNGLYKIRNVNSGMYLAAYNGTGGSSNLVQKSANNSDKTQNWFILKDPGSGRYVLKPSNSYHAVMTTKANAKESGTSVRDENFADGAGQYWVITNATVYVKNSIYKPASGSYFISPSAASVKAVGVDTGKLTNSANVQLTSRTNSNAVKWRIYPNDDGTYTIQNVKSGKVLDVSGANFTSGSNIHQYTANGTKAQKWTFRRTGDKDGSFYIVSADNNLVLDITGARFVTGSNIWLYSKNNTAAQKYSLAKSGVVKSGWVTAVSGNRYFYNTDGKPVTGWKKISGYYYYFRSSGIMARNTTVEGYAIDSEGVSNKTDFKTATGGRTIRALLTNAVAPCGKVLYIWGGGWGGMGTSVEADSSKIGMLPTWTQFYNANARAGYDYKNYKFNYGMGLDCSGFTAWAVYNTIYDRDNVEDIVASSSGTAAYYISRGWCYDSGNTFKPGDVVSRSGHVWICMGTCTDGSVLIMHSTPEGTQLSGTDGKSIELAQKYMKMVSPNWPFHIHQNGPGYLAYVGKATWKTDGTGILTDPDGMQNMTAEQVCKIVFGS